jgi:hypothetical protein
MFRNYGAASLEEPRSIAWASSFAELAPMRRGQIPGPKSLELDRGVELMSLAASPG